MGTPNHRMSNSSLRGHRRKGIGPQPTSPLEDGRSRRTPSPRPATERVHQSLWSPSGPYLLAAIWVALGIGSPGLSAQTGEDTTAAKGEASPLEQVYKDRIANLQDSLFITRERLDASTFAFTGMKVQLQAMNDSLMLERGLSGQLTDSLTGRLGALTDSLASAGQHAMAQDSLIDSLMTLVAASQSHLETASLAEDVYADSISTIRQALDSLRLELAAGEERMTGMYEQMKEALAGESMNTSEEEALLAYLQGLDAYRASGGRLSRRSRKKAEEQINTYRISEINAYLERYAPAGHTPEALNLLGNIYVKMGAVELGILTYIKTLFLFPGSSAASEAENLLEGLVKKNTELERLFREVALVPDSTDVGSEEFHLYFNYLSHLQDISRPTAKTRFIEEARQFLGAYPGSVQADQIHLWMAEAAHTLGNYHDEILTYMKIRALYTSSALIPRVVLALAKVTTENVKDPAGGAKYYGQFVAEFPTHDEAPAALYRQAELSERELKDYAQAGTLYALLADSYPQNELAPAGLLRRAQLLNSQMSSPTGAVTAYQNLLDRYGARSPEYGINALLGMATISHRLRQNDEAIAYYMDIHQRYPDAKEAVESILKAADIYQKEDENIDAAIHTLQVITTKYPNHKSSKSAQRRIDRMEKKRK